jgi:hypothetical protein
LVVAPSATAFAAPPLAQDGSQLPKYPAVDFPKLPGMDVFEESIPAFEFPIQFCHHGLHAPSAGALGPRFDGFAQFAQAFGPDELDQTTTIGAFEPSKQSTVMWSTPQAPALDFTFSQAS